MVRRDGDKWGGEVGRYSGGGVMGYSEKGGD